MAKIEVSPYKYIPETMQVMASGGGLLLVSVDDNGKPNAMTIGWATMGMSWGKPLFLALVRPSRYTYQLIESTMDFTVNVPPVGWSEIQKLCGTMSGRDHDKIAESKLTTVPGKTIKSPTLEQCVISYECKVVHYNDLQPETFAPGIDTNCYPRGDYHRIYFGEIQAAFADPEAVKEIKVA